MARRDKKGKDGMKRQKEKMPRRDKKKRWHEEITRRNVSSLSYGHEESHIPTLPNKDVADRFLYRMIFFSSPLAYGTYSTKASMAS